MSPLTTRGYPFPDGDDNNDTVADITALAQALNIDVQTLADALAGKADAGHNHNALYLPVGHKASVRDHDDVSDNVPADGQILVWRAAGGGAFVPEAFPAAGIPPSVLDAKGDLIVASANDTPARLGIGANGTVPVADAAQALGIRWGNPAMVENLASAVGSVLARAQRAGEANPRMELREIGLLLGLGAGNALRRLLKDDALGIASRNVADNAYQGWVGYPFVIGLAAAAGGTVLTDLGQSWGHYKTNASPEGVVSASPGSTASDFTNGDFWIKVTGTGSTGWQKVLRGTPSIFIPAQQMTVLDGAAQAVIGAGTNRTVVITFADAATQRVAFSYVMPDSAKTTRVTAIFAPSTNAGGNVRLETVLNGNAETNALDGAFNAEAQLLTAGMPTNIAHARASAAFPDFGMSAVPTGSSGQWVRGILSRLGADALDTYGGVFELVGLRITFV